MYERIVLGFSGCLFDRNCSVVPLPLYKTVAKIASKSIKSREIINAYRSISS